MAADETVVLSMPRNVSFGGTDLGLTRQGGVTVDFDPHNIIKKGDQYGETPLGVLSGGDEVKVTVDLIEWSIAHLKIALPFSRRLSNSGYNGLTGGFQPGRNATSQSLLKELILHRAIDAAATKTYDFTVYKAMVTSAPSIEDKSEDFTSFPIEFMGFVDFTKTNGNLVWRFGDTNASTLAES